MRKQNRGSREPQMNLWLERASVEHGTVNSRIKTSHEKKLVVINRQKCKGRELG